MVTAKTVELAWAEYARDGGRDRSRGTAPHRVAIVASAAVLPWNFEANRPCTFSIDLADSPKSTDENSL